MLARNNKPISMKLMEKQYGHEVNEKNIVRISRLALWGVFHKEDVEMKDMYLHNIISKWILAQENTDEEFFRILKRMIHKTKISLTELEKHDLQLLEERAFSKERHIKVIDVNYKLSNKETVGVKYVDARLFRYSGRTLTKRDEGDLLISNRRIIIVGEENHEYKFSEIQWYKYTEFGFEFKCRTHTYVIRIHDQVTLNNTIENIISKKVKNAIKKRKDN